MTRRALRGAGRAAAVVALGVAASLSACGGEEVVCKGTPERIVVVPFTSISDFKVSQELTPTVVKTVAARAAESCGTVGGGVASRTVESDLVLDFAEQLEPDRAKAPNRKPYVATMRHQAEEALKTRVLEPLAEARPTAGSPFLGALAKVAAEFKVRGYQNGSVIVLVGDIIDIERSPSGRSIDFRRAALDRRALKEFLPLLKPLAGSCVVAIGAGAHSTNDPAILRRNRTVLEQLLAKADIRFEATRAPELPDTCRVHRLADANAR